MKIEISDEHIKNLAKINNYQIKDLDKLKNYLKEKIADEVQEDGATHLCVFIEKLIHLAYEDGIDFDLIEI